MVAIRILLLTCMLSAIVCDCLETCAQQQVEPLDSTQEAHEGNVPSQASLDQVANAVASYIEQGDAVGAELLVISHGENLYHRSFGSVDLESNTPWKNDTLCNIRSMTKSITSAAAQILIDRGKIQLDDPVSKYLESFDNDKSRMITVEQVLTHRSGLPLTNLERVDQFENLEEQTAAAGKAGPEFEPGSKFWYSDIGTDVVGRIVEVVSGEPLHVFVTREIFQPLGMENTFYGIDESDPRLNQAATLYMKTPKTWMKIWQAGGKSLYPFAWGSQTVYSTTTDYAKFLQLVANDGKIGDKQILSTAAIERMLKPVSRMTMMGSDAQTPTGFRNLETWYGQMMVTYRKVESPENELVVFGHSGSDGTVAWTFPDRDLTIVYFTQSRGGLSALRIEEDIDREILHAGEKTTEVVPESMKSYLGSYIANFADFNNEEFTVKFKGGKLILDIPSQMAFELLEPDAEGNWPFAIAPDQVNIYFERDADEKVIGLTMTQGGKSFEVPRKGSLRDREIAAAKAERLAEMKAKKAKEKLKEAWVGELDLGGIKPVMQFRLVTNEAGEVVAYFDSITEAQTDFEATWSIAEDVIRFDVPRIKLTFEGKMNQEGDTAEGTWKQGGREFPLTLKRQETEYKK